MTYEQSQTAKACRVINAANELARQYDAEGETGIASQVRGIVSLPMESLAKLCDILSPPMQRSGPLNEVLGATENIGSLLSRKEG